MDQWFKLDCRLRCPQFQAPLGAQAALKKPGTIVLEILPPIPPGLPRATFMAELEERIETASARLAGLPAATDESSRRSTGEEEAAEVP